MSNFENLHDQPESGNTPDNPFDMLKNRQKRTVAENKSLKTEMGKLQTNFRASVKAHNTQLCLPRCVAQHCPATF